MFAIMAFKNLYPKDFSDLQNESGVVKEAFSDKQKFIYAQSEVLHIIEAAGELDALIRAEDAPLAAGLSCTPANLEQIMVHLEREAEA